jgi:hypothetical protein
MAARPPFDGLEQRLNRVLDGAPELVAYQRWLGEQPPRRRIEGDDRDYLFAREQPRFEPRRDDVVVAIADLKVASHRGGCVLRCLQPKLELAVDGVAPAECERLLAAIDGERCLLEVRWEAKVKAPVMARFLRATFGRVIMAPRAVEQLEREVSACEVVRFAVPAYAIERSYWSNMVAVRHHFDARHQALEGLDPFVQLLRELHVLTLMGRTLEDFYRPASPGAERQVEPGSFAPHGARLLRRSGQCVFLEGLRVRAPLMGGAAWHRRLYRELGDEAALAPSRVLSHDDALPLGELVEARGEHDDDFGPWFCPPRPLQTEHLERLRATLQAAVRAAERDDRDAASREAAAFHHAFVRLHPFSCANQSLAMNLVNATLRSAFGAGIPHGVLDHHALRLELGAYQRLFARAVATRLVAGENAAARLAELYRRKQLAFAFVAAAANCADDEQLAAQMARDPEGARYALLSAEA